MKERFESGCYCFFHPSDSDYCSTSIRLILYFFQQRSHSLHAFR